MFGGVVVTLLDYYHSRNFLRKMGYKEDAFRVGVLSYQGVKANSGFCH